MSIMPFARLALKAQQEYVESEGQGDLIYLFIFYRFQEHITLVRHLHSFPRARLCAQPGIKDQEARTEGRRAPGTGADPASGERRAGVWEKKGWGRTNRS